MSMLKAMKTVICGEGRTKQKVGIEHDINKMIAKIKRTGQMPSLRYDGMKFDDGEQVIDLTGIGDFQECQNRIATASEIFDGYPSIIRRRFNNNVEDFVTFMGSLNTKENLDEAVRLGILEIKKQDPGKPNEPTITPGKDPTPVDDKN